MKNTYKCSDWFSNLQLVYFKRYTRLYPVNTMFLCVLHVLLTDSSIFARFHWVSVKVTSQWRKKNTFTVFWAYFKPSASLFSEIHTFVSCQYDVFWVFCMLVTNSSIFAWFHWVSIKVTSQLRKKNTYKCSDWFSNLQLVYFQRYTRLYLTIRCFLCVLYVLMTDSLIWLGSIEF